VFTTIETDDESSEDGTQQPERNIGPFWMDRHSEIHPSAYPDNINADSRRLPLQAAVVFQL
jgi:hypothetical protein